MNSFTSSPDGSLTVRINNPVDYILGCEKISIPHDVLTMSQCLELLERYAHHCRPYLRHAGVSIEDYTKNTCRWKTTGFASVLPEGITVKVRIVQLSAEYWTSNVTGIPQQEPPSALDSKWRIHTLFLSETGTFLWVSIACVGSFDSQLHIKTVATEFITKLFSNSPPDFFETALKQFGVMWSNVAGKMEGRAHKAREQASAHQRILERANLAPVAFQV